MTSRLTLSNRMKLTKCLVERRSKGKLYVAEDRITQEISTIRKIYLDITNAGQDDGLPTSVLREISHLRSLNHPNIVKLRNAEINENVVQLCFEHHENNLKEFIRKFARYGSSKLERPSTSMPTPIMKKLLYQILQGLNYIHRHGVMHRNLKSDNILVTSDENIKIGDFSLSRIVLVPHIAYTPEDPKERERSGREARRLWYRSPELLYRKNLYSFEVDMWAIGCLIGEIALGEPLFNGESEIEQLFKIYRLTGTPTKDTLSEMSNNTEEIVQLPSWERVHFRNICAPKGSAELNQIVNAFLPTREDSLKKLIDIKDRIGVEGVDLLW